MLSLGTYIAFEIQIGENCILVRVYSTVHMHATVKNARSAEEINWL
jgi:hypothetical protein